MDIKIVAEELKEPVSKSVKHSIKMYINCEIEDKGMSLQKGSPTLKDNHDIISFINLTGGLQGSLFLYISKNFAIQIAKQMFGCQEIGSDSEILDTVAELNNVIAGTLKNLFASHKELNFHISPPKVFYSNADIQMKQDSESYNITHTFNIGGDHLLVCISLDSEKFSSVPTSLEGKTVLIADDDEIILALANKILESAGALTLTARNGEEAVEVFQTNQNKISFILMDILMPKMNGIDATKLIKDLKPNVPVYFVTAYSDKDLPSGLSETDKKNLIKKPLTKKNVLDKILAG